MRPADIIKTDEDFKALPLGARIIWVGNPHNPTRARVVGMSWKRDFGGLRLPSEPAPSTSGGSGWELISLPKFSVLTEAPAGNYKSANGGDWIVRTDPITEVWIGGRGLWGKWNPAWKTYGPFQFVSPLGGWPSEQTPDSGAANTPAAEPKRYCFLCDAPPGFYVGTAQLPVRQTRHEGAGAHQYRYWRGARWSAWKGILKVPAGEGPFEACEDPSAEYRTGPKVYDKLDKAPAGFYTSAVERLVRQVRNIAKQEYRYWREEIAGGKVGHNWSGWRAIENMPSGVRNFTPCDNPEPKEQTMPKTYSRLSDTPDGCYVDNAVPPIVREVLGDRYRFINDTTNGAWSLWYDISRCTAGVAPFTPCEDPYAEPKGTASSYKSLNGAPSGFYRTRVGGTLQWNGAMQTRLWIRDMRGIKLKSSWKAPTAALRRQAPFYPCDNPYPIVEPTQAQEGTDHPEPTMEERAQEFFLPRTRPLAAFNETPLISRTVSRSDNLSGEVAAMLQLTAGDIAGPVMQNVIHPDMPPEPKTAKVWLVTAQESGEAAKLAQDKGVWGGEL